MPGSFRFEPCANCCVTGCVYESDDFDRANNTDLGAKWTETSGDWSIDGNRLKIVATANAKATCTTTHPTASTKYIVSASITLGTDGDVARVWIDDSAFFAELERITSTCGRLRLYDGATCKGSCNVSLGGYTRLVVCSEGDKVHVGTGGSPMLTVPATVASSIVALGTGGTCTGTVYFEDFSLSKHSEDDATCPACGSEGCVWQNDNGCASGSLRTVDWTTTGTWAYTLTFAIDVYFGTWCSADGYLESAVTEPTGTDKGTAFWDVYFSAIKLTYGATITWTLQNGTAYAKLLYESGSWVVKVYDAGGVQYGPTSILTYVGPWPRVKITMCHDGTSVIVYVEHTAAVRNTISVPATVTALVPRATIAGLSSGSVGVNTLFSKHSTDVAGCQPCATASCVNCSAGTFCNTARVVIANITSVDYGCTCTDVTINLAAAASGCVWTGTATGPCSSGTWTATATVSAVTGGYKLTVTVTTSTGVSATYENTVLSGSPVDCMTAFDGDVPLVSSAGSLHCTLPSSTCTFTAPAP